MVRSRSRATPAAALSERSRAANTSSNSRFSAVAPRAVHHAAVGQCVQRGRGVDAGDPQPPEFPLLAAPVAIGVPRRPLDRLLRGFPQLAAPAEVALGELHHLVLALQARDVAFDARHGPAPYAISRRLRRRSSACDTSAALRRCRFRLGCFLVRMWLL